MSIGVTRDVGRCEKTGWLLFSPRAYRAFNLSVSHACRLVQTMSRIHYEGVDGEERTIERDECHAESEPFVTAYDQQQGEPPTRKVQIPLDRVIEIFG